MAGTTLAKYLRLWGTNIDVTLIDRNAKYTSNIYIGTGKVDTVVSESIDRLRKQGRNY